VFFPKEVLLPPPSDLNRAFSLSFFNVGPVFLQKALLRNSFLGVDIIRLPAYEWFIFLILLFF